MADQKYTYIQSVTPGMKNVNINFIVLDVGQPRHTKEGHDVRTVKVSDTSGSINLTVWNDAGEHINSGDIFRLRNGYANIHKGMLTVTCGKFGELMKTGEFFMAYSELPNMSDVRMDLVEKRRSPPPDDSSSHEGSSSNGSGGGSNGKPSNGSSTNSGSKNIQATTTTSCGTNNGGTKASTVTAPSHSFRSVATPFAHSEDDQNMEQWPKDWNAPRMPNRARYAPYDIRGRQNIRSFPRPPVFPMRPSGPAPGTWHRMGPRPPRRQFFVQP